MELKFDRTASQYVVINESIFDPDDFMYPTYSRLADALNEVVRKAVNERRGSRAQSSFASTGTISNSDLYGYGNNLIAISGRRGQGKTSAMLSFSHALSKTDTYADCNGRFGDKSFLILDPIDPTVLEASSSPLMLILSRMYRKVEEAWESYLAPGGYSANNHMITDARKNELINQFQKCHADICALKSRDGGGNRGLSSLHSLSDSSQLKMRFYSLVNMLLDFCTGGRKDDAFLVVQLDDTDFQIDKGYEVLDDIRKYLTLPNVIILMATDMDLMYKVVAQHFARELETGIAHKIVNRVEIENNARKYLDKLVPPHQIVYLPKLDHAMSRLDEMLKVRLLDDGNQILPAPGEEALSLENTILRYLYRKTDILCVSREGELHSLIPSTLRGMIQLLNLLTLLEDIPPVDEKAKENPRSLADALEKRLAVKERNLKAFEGYLVNTWVNAKFSAATWRYSASRVRNLMVHIVGDAGIDDRCISMLRRLNALVAYRNDSSRECLDSKEKTDTIEGLFEEMVEGDWLMAGLLDNCFVDAINMSAAIRWHKVATRKMRSEIAAMRESEGAYAFHLAHEETGLPANFWINRSTQRDDAFYRALDAYISSNPRRDITLIGNMLAPDGEFRVLNIAAVILSMAGDEESTPLVGYSSIPQAAVYDIQEAMLAIACNPEVQRELICIEESSDNIMKLGPEEQANFVERIVAKLDDCEGNFDLGLGSGSHFDDVEKLSLIPRQQRFAQVLNWIGLSNDMPDSSLSSWFLGLSIAVSRGPKVLQMLYERCLTYINASEETMKGFLQQEALELVSEFGQYLQNLPSAAEAAVSKSMNSLRQIETMIIGMPAESNNQKSRLRRYVTSICKALSFDEKAVLRTSQSRR